MSTTNQPIERMTEEQLQKIEIRLFPASYERYNVISKPEIRHLITALRNAYAEIDALRSELGAMARQLAEVTDDYEIVSRLCAISDGLYDGFVRAGLCVCSGYRDAQEKPARDPQCRAHGEETE